MSLSKCFLNEGSFFGSWKLKALGVVSLTALLFLSSWAANSLWILLKSGTSFGGGILNPKLAYADAGAFFSFTDFSFSFFSWASILGGSFDYFNEISEFFFILLFLSASASSTKDLNSGTSTHHGIFFALKGAKS